MTNLVQTPDIKHETYQRLGSRAFWIFFFQKSGPFIWLGVIILFMLATLNRVTIDEQFVLPVYISLSSLVALFSFAFLIGIGAAWLHYIAFGFMFDEHALKIKSGIFYIHIEAIPYRQIQNIDIERSVLYRLFGLSRIVILTAGEEGGASSEESEGIIPALDKELANELQHELMKRANIERVADIHHNDSMSSDNMDDELFGTTFKH